MTSLPHWVLPAPGPTRSAGEEPAAHDIYVLTTQVVHRAETLLASAEGYAGAVAQIEAAFDVALSVTTRSTWADVRTARELLDVAQGELDRCGYRLR